MFLAPGVKRTDKRREALTTLAEGVLDAGRNLGIDLAGDEFVLFELTEGLDKHLFAHSGDEFLQLTIALGP